MSIDKLISDAMKGYNAYLHSCDLLAVEAQKYIDWDDFVSCEYINGTGLSILVTLPVSGNYDLPERVCPIVGFFEYAKGKDKLSVDDI